MADAPKRKQENALTARAESGSLRVKILRRTPPASAPKTAPRPQSAESPPKPRPNRKHVPIFYRAAHEEQVRRHSHSHSSSSSTDASSTSLTEPMGRLNAQEPQANPLFSRQDSDGLGELLKPYFPSPGGSAAGLLVDQPLHELAASTASYRSALTAFREQEQPKPLESYKFDPLAALQSAIDQADRLAKKDNPPKSDGPREVGSANSDARFIRVEPADKDKEVKITRVYRLHPSGETESSEPPEPAVLALQNSLMGGGIQGLAALKTHEEKTEVVAEEDAALGPPPELPPAFTLQNSLMGGGISILNLPKHLGLSRLNSTTSESSEGAKEVHLPSLRTVSDAGASKAAEDSKDDDLGPPPSGPPAFTIGNSLMGGGIELQPPVTHVNTHNFNWKLHKSTSSSGVPSSAGLPAHDGESHSPKSDSS